MLPRAAVLGFAFAVAGCTHQLVLDDVHDSGTSDSNAVAVKDAAWVEPDGYCDQGYQQLIYTPRSAQVVILLDRSTSMLSDFDGTTRQDAAQNALIDAVKRYQARIKFGLEQFPAGPAAQCQPGTCCAGQVYPQPFTNNGQAIADSIQCNYPHSPYCQPTGSDSPSYEALATVYDNFVTSHPNEDRYVLLVTSSEPSCAAENRDVCPDARMAATALGKLDNAGHIVVLSLGYQPHPGSCLYRISQTSSVLPQLPSTHSLYTPNTVDDLAKNLDEFFNAVASSTACTMNSKTTIPPSWADLLVSIGQDQVQRANDSGQDGWSYANPDHTSITLSGQACQTWLFSQLPIAVDYHCSLCGGPNSCPPHSP